MIQRRHGKLLPWLVLIAGLVATYFLQQVSFSSARELQQEHFTSQAREIKLRIQYRLEIYEQVLQGVRGLYVSSKSVERDEFHNYINVLRLSDNYPAIQSVGFGLIVPSQVKDRHVESIQKDGFPTYRVHPERERSSYVPVVYVEPFSDTNLHRFGYDIYSDPVLRAGMEGV
jgi:CHASE1-domain containing sensor protein